MYQLVFRGEWEGDLDEQTARERARGLFKANDAQLEKMFSGDRVVIKNRLDEATAGKYQAAMKKSGLVAHIEPMPQSDSEGADPAPTAASASSSEEEEQGARAPAGDSVAVEPGDRLPVAGEEVDSILAGSGLSLGAPGERLGETRDVPEPEFEHLDEWSVAPPGEDLVTREDVPDPPAPDVSHLSLDDKS